MMEDVRVPPFERFYEEHQRAVLTQLRRMLGRDAADDAFQETFLRALRAYATLEHGRHLRAWVLTIARNVALGTTELVSVSTAGVQSASHSFGPSVSADGRYVTFSSVSPLDRKRWPADSSSRRSSRKL